jgi:uncharacterized protein YggT (Ycf19 family)
VLDAITAVMLRLLLQWVRPISDPVCQFLRVTNGAAALAARDTGHRPAGSASVLLMLALSSSASGSSYIGSTPLSPGNALFSVTKLLATLLVTYFILIIANVLLSWVAGAPGTPCRWCTSSPSRSCGRSAGSFHRSPASIYRRCSP